MFASPVAVVGLSRMVLLPAFSDAVTVVVAHVVHPPVPLNATPDCAAAPLTSTSAGRLAVVPLAYRTAIVPVRAADAVRVNGAAAPAVLLPLQKPLPE